NSPFTEGKPNGFVSFRSEIWRDTDNQRAGMLPFVFEPGMGFERYVDYALDVPTYFIKRGDRYMDIAGKSFRDHLAGKLIPGDLAVEMLRLSEQGLIRRNKLDPNGRNETRYLRPLQEIAARGITPAEELLEKYHGPWNGSVEPIFDEYAY